MNPYIDALSEKITALQTELDAELAKRHAELRIGLEKGRVAFEEEILRRHREMKTALAAYVFNAHPLIILTAPFIYILIVPLVLLDLFVSLYQAVCFPAYGIEKVRRADCAYCSYANGLIAYVREIAARTEQYWCPIKHARRVIGAHPHYMKFDDYGDAASFNKRKAEWAQKPDGENAS
jgi:hypothetical protein